MLTVSTMEQILEVIQKAKEYYLGGEPLDKAYSLACNIVRRRENVAYQTIADGCIRRLGFVGYGATGRFHKVLLKWLNGDAGELKNLLMSKADRNASKTVGAFFDGNSGSKKMQTPRVSDGTTQESEVVSFRLPTKMAQQMKVLADAKGLSVSEWVSKTVTGVIDAELRDLVAKMISNMPDKDRQEFLRDLAK